MVPVRKPDGTIRLCIDFRKVNSIAVPDPFKILLIEDILDSLSEAKYLSKLDMTKGFYQIPVLASDQDQTAFEVQFHQDAHWVAECTRDLPEMYEFCVRGLRIIFKCIH